MKKDKIITLFLSAGNLMLLQYLLISNGKNIENIIELIVFGIVFYIPIILHLLSPLFNNIYLQIIKKIIMALMLTIFFLLFILMGMAFVPMLMFKSSTSVYQTKYPVQEEYSNVIGKMSDKLYQIKHFPYLLPKKCNNYYYVIEDTRDGLNIDYLKFNTNQKYIDNIIQKNKENINKILRKEQIQDSYVDLNYIEGNRNEDCMFYILKNENNDYGYTSGIITSEKAKEIIFFFADYNLDKTGEVNVSK